MPLIDLKTDLKSLKFGQDRPGGGNSGLPYIQSPLPEVASAEFKDLYDANKYNLDFPIRGGAFDLGLSGPYITKAAKLDQQRIKRFLKDPSRGTIFILKQTAMQLANPKIQTGAQLNLDLQALTFGSLFNSENARILENTRIYNGGRNTLAQVGVQGSGLHYERHGTVPINPYQQTYIYVANDRLVGETKRNRLVNLYNTKITTTGNVPLTTPDLKVLNDLGISRTQGLLFQYPGGPSSIGGLGLTTIHRRYTSTQPTLRTYITGSGPSVVGLYNRLIENGSSDIILYSYSVDSTVGYAYSGSGNLVTVKRQLNTDQNTTIGTTVGTLNLRNFNYTYNYQQLAAAKEDGSIGSHKVLKDFRTTFKDKIASTEGYEVSNNLEVKYGTGNPASTLLNRVNYTKTHDSTQDKINMLDVGQYDSGSNQDLIKFVFETMEVDSRESTPIVFRAFLSSLQDNHNAEWNPFRYVGRGENFYSYQGFTRAISFNFKIAPQTRSEMKPLYRKLNYLASQLYPDYSSFDKGLQTGFMRGPIIKMTIGDYLFQQPGFLTSFNIAVPDDSPWEIVLAGQEVETDVYQLPHVLEVACQFTPIHNFLPRRSYMTTPNNSSTAKITPLITPNASNNKFDIAKYNT